MLVDLSNAVGNYLHDVFWVHLDWWVLPVSYTHLTLPTILRV